MEQPSKPEVGIVKQGILKSLSKPSKKQLLILLISLIIITAGIISYLVLKSPDIKVPPKADISDVADYSEMTYEQKNYYLYTKTGLTIEYLKSKKSLTPKTFETFESAYESAQLFFALGDYNRSVESYAAADAKGPKADDYKFHLKYAYAALLGKDKTTWKQQMLAAKDIASKLPNSGEGESTVANSIQSQIILTEAAGDE